MVARMSAIAQLQRLAANNAWSNLRLHRACAALETKDYEAKRTSFFPSIPETLNHILIVDWFYLDGLEHGGRGPSTYAEEIPYPRLPDLAAAQRGCDLRLVRFCDAVGEQDLERSVALDRGEHGVTHEAVHAVLSHLFVHQIHHRGQAHAMLAGTSVPPPQLDEFFLAWDAPLRRAELEELGFASGLSQRA
jgi:uncharacterized damage-inducible protein DinB